MRIPIAGISTVLQNLYVPCLRMFHVCCI